MASNDELPSRDALFRHYRGKPAIQIADTEDEEAALGLSAIDEETIEGRAESGAPLNLR